jgi:hypothetical protein
MLAKFQKIKHVGWKGGLIKLFNAKFSPNYVFFTSTKEMKVKNIFKEKFKFTPFLVKFTPFEWCPD